MKRSLLVFCAMGALLVLGSGCNMGPKEKLTDAGPAALQPGWKLWSNDEKGVSVAAPSNWSDKQVVAVDPMTGQPMDPDSMPKEVKDMLGDIPNQMKEQEAEEKAAQAREDAKDGVLVRLFDNSSRPLPGEVPTSILVTEQGGSGTLEGDVAEYKRNFKSEDIKSAKKVDLPVGPAHEFIVESTDVKGDVVKRVAYLFSHDGKSYRVVLRQTNGAGAIDSIGMEVAKTFRLKVK